MKNQHGSKGKSIRANGIGTSLVVTNTQQPQQQGDNNNNGSNGDVFSLSQENLFVHTPSTTTPAANTQWQLRYRWLQQHERQQSHNINSHESNQNTTTATTTATLAQKRIQPQQPEKRNDISPSYKPRDDHGKNYNKTAAALDAEGDYFFDAYCAGSRDDDEDDEYASCCTAPPHATCKALFCCSSQDSKLQKLRLACGAIVNHEWVQLGIIALIVVNALMMGLGTFDFVTQYHRTEHAFATTDTVFLALFTVELAMQLIYHGIYLFTDGWLLFDFVVVVLSWSLESLQVVRAFRIFRAVRLVTRLSILRNLVMAIFAVAPSMFAIIALLLLILYVYAVMCTVLFKDLYSTGVTDQDYFGSLGASLFTLFTMMTLEWADVVRQVMTVDSWAWTIFVTFLIMTSFILYSLIIAVVCDAVKVAEQQQQSEEAANQEKEETTAQRIDRLNRKLQELTAQQQQLFKSLQMALAAFEEEQARAQSNAGTLRNFLTNLMPSSSPYASPSRPQQQRARGFLLLSSQFDESSSEPESDAES